MGSIRDLQRALELAHYAARHRGTVHVCVLDGSLSMADFGLDLRLLGAYGIRVIVVAHWRPDASFEGLGDARRLGLPLALIDGGDDLTAITESAKQAVGRGQVPLVVCADRSGQDSGTEPLSVGAHLAQRLGARRILFLLPTNDPLLSVTSRPHLTRQEASALAPSIGDPSVRRRFERLRSLITDGVPGVVLLEGFAGAVFTELFTHEGAGILLSDDLLEVVRPASVEDTPDITLLLRAGIERGVIRPVTETQLLETISDHMVYCIDGLVVGTARLTPYGEWAELARFGMMARYRGRGRARTLCLALIDRARRQGCLGVFALSIDERMWRFFESLELDAVERSTLPIDWQSGYDFSRPSRAFAKRIDGSG